MTIPKDVKTSLLALFSGLAVTVIVVSLFHKRSTPP